MHADDGTSGGRRRSRQKEEEGGERGRGKGKGEREKKGKEMKEGKERKITNLYHGRTSIIRKVMQKQSSEAKELASLRENRFDKLFFLLSLFFFSSMSVMSRIRSRSPNLPRGVGQPPRGRRPREVRGRGRRRSLRLPCLKGRGGGRPACTRART